jgi:acetyl-CoA carboxylase biotin carboxyl carrier protein
LEDSQMSMKIDYDEITKLVSFLEEKNLTQFELEVEGFKIKIARGAAQPSQAVPAPVQTAPPQPTSTSGSSLDFAKAPESSNNIHYVTSPMVGTFYRAPDPASEPYVEIGEQVKKSQTLCIIEAMKLMNEIESDVDGEVMEIFVENGKSVEYGQRLFAVRPVS